MYHGEIWGDEQRARHARDERSRIHQHIQAIREARRGSRQSSRASNPIRRRVGGSIIRIGQRVAGDHIGTPVLTG
jgi:hypothetical protein